MSAEAAVSPPAKFAGSTGWARSSVLIFALAVAAGCSSTRVAENLLHPPDRAVYGSGSVRPALVPRAPNGFPGPVYHSTQARVRGAADAGDASFRVERDDAPGSTLAPVRVLLAVANGPFAIWSPTELEVELYPGDRPLVWNNRLSVDARGDTLIIEGQSVGPEARVRSSDSELGIEFQGRRYAGELKFLAESGKVRVLNELPLEEYLRGVVPAEVPPSWSPEALKTIAVAARTYALFQMEKSTGRSWDVTDSIDTQMYGGLSSADPRGDRAVRETEGQILIYDGAPILATYHAASGGYTEDARRVWSKDVPYLRAQPDPAPDADATPWRVSVGFREVEQVLRAGGYRVTKVSGLDVLQRTPSGRAATVRVRHSRGFLDIAADRMKAMLGGQRIRSTLFQITRTKTAFVITGRGFGHGVGLSQMGAAALAKDGVAYDQILYAYYPGTQLARLQ
ncbi:MAG: SpoIID/LytB domain-containing protein [bacterium]